MISVMDPNLPDLLTGGDNGLSDTRRVRIVGIGGSTRLGSKSLIMLKTALRIADEAGAISILADVRELDLPLYDDDKPLDWYPESLARLLKACEAADAFIFSSPTYHGTVTGAVKNVLDCLNFLWNEEAPYLHGKPVGLMAMGGPGSMNTINALHHSARGLNGISVPIAATIPGNGVDEAHGVVTDQNGLTRMQATVTELIDLASRLRRPLTVPLEEWEREALVTQ
jgi:FMN reductase